VTTPKHWSKVRLKYACRIFGGGTPAKDRLEYWGGDIPWVSPKDMGTFRLCDSEDHITSEAVSSSATQVVPPGSVLVVVRSGILRHTLPVSVTTRQVAINQDMKALVPKPQIVPEFLAYSIFGRQRELLCEWRKQGTTVESIEQNLLANCWIAFPDSAEQEAIIAILNAETAKIDDLIARKQRLIELLEEKRAALISRAVTQGLDPGLPMKDSGVEWLGRVPAHWRVAAAKHFSRIFVPNRDKPQLSDNGEYPWITLDEIRGKTQVGNEHARQWVTAEAVQAATVRVLKPGSVIASCVGVLVST